MFGSTFMNNPRQQSPLEMIARIGYAARGGVFEE
jgi:hypothetical protein